MEKLKDKLIELSILLKKRDNKAFDFFEKLASDVDENHEGVIDIILKSYSITQYANLNYNEELLLDEIWNLANNLKKHSHNYSARTDF